MTQLISFYLGAATTIVAAMAAYAITNNVPPWIDTLARWGTPRKRLPKLRDVDVSAEVELPDDYVPPSEDGYHGRHRRLELEQDRGWREYHAQWPTQGWPTLATEIRTSGELLDHRPDICVGVQEANELPLVGWTGRPVHAAIPTEPILVLADL